MNRAPLPTRRPNATITTQWHNHALTVTVGYDPATGAPAEVFANTERGGDMQHAVADACVLISIALQYGVTLAALGKSLGREPDFLRGETATNPASPIGAIIEAMQ